MNFEEQFPSFEKIEWAVKTNDKQLFSYRNNLSKVVPEDVVKNYLMRHCLDERRVKEALQAAALGIEYTNNTEKDINNFIEYVYDYLKLEGDKKSDQQN